MSEMPHCTALRRGARLQNERDFLTRIREFNENLRNSAPEMKESIAHIRGLRNVAASAATVMETALKMQRKVSGCTIEVHKCIQ